MKLPSNVGNQSPCKCMLYLNHLPFLQFFKMPSKICTLLRSHKNCPFLLYVCAFPVISFNRFSYCPSYWTHNLTFQSLLYAEMEIVSFCMGIFTEAFFISQIK